MSFASEVVSAEAEGRSCRDPRPLLKDGETGPSAASVARPAGISWLGRRLALAAPRTRRPCPGGRSNGAPAGRLGFPTERARHLLQAERKSMANTTNEIAELKAQIADLQRELAELRPKPAASENRPVRI